MMYGTVARLRVKPGMEDELRADFERQKQFSIPGLVGECLYRMDQGPGCALREQSGVCG
jgi:hypothetical protein